MDLKRKPLQKLKVTKDFRNDTAGIMYTILPPEERKDAADDDSLADEPAYSVMPDPVIPHNREARRKPPKTPPEKPRIEGTLLNPTLSARLEFHQHYHPVLKPGEIVRYIPPKPKAKKRPKELEEIQKQKERQKRRELTVVRLPSPVNTMNVDKFEIISPELSKVKVMPARPSVQSGYLYPEPPTEDELALHKPRSGIFLNVIDETKDSDESLLAGPAAKRRKKEKPTEIEEEEEGLYEEWEEEYYEDFVYEEGESPLRYDKSTAVDKDSPLRMIRKVVQKSSKATSLDEKDFVFEEKSWQKIPVISQLVQTFRVQDERCKKKKRKFKKGTLESHSYTKLKQKTLCQVCLKCVQGSIHQGDENFSTVRRNKQGICIPIAALCYTKMKCIKNPEDWTEKAVDEIIELGDSLYVDSIKNIHLHREKRKLTPVDVQKFCVIDEMKVKFEIDDPDVNGHVRSTDKRIYNLTKGLTIFFNRHKRALFQTDSMNLAIWKKRNYFYVFDGNPRRKDGYEDLNGKAAVIILETLKAVVTVLLDRTNLENYPFLLSKITITKILKTTDEDIDFDYRGIYNVLSNKKAVVNGTFDLGDKCFCFTRNKQALPMAIVCLVYARISQPAMWKKKTIDKIMVVGNQLYIECAESEKIIDQDLNIENIPALFTVGPYIVEIFIYANYMADNLYKKGQCGLKKALDNFFEKNTSAIIQMGKYTIAVWCQRGMFYYFDPYSRNTEGLKCRNGSACVSMNCDVSTLLETLTANFDDREAIFYIHALKVIKINRDPSMSKAFPKSVPMNDVPIDLLKNIRCRKSKKKAIQKPLRTDFTEYAMKKLLAGDQPGASLTDIASNIGSLNDEYLPPFKEKAKPKEVIKTEIQEKQIADLDSPNLSETQIAPERPQPMQQEALLTLMDLDALEMTQEELEEMAEGEAEGEGEDGRKKRGRKRKRRRKWKRAMKTEKKKEKKDTKTEKKVVKTGKNEVVEEEEDMGEEEDLYMAKSVYASVNSSSLESMHMRRSEVMNTDISYCYNILPAQELPVQSKRDPHRAIVIDEEIQRMELERETKFKSREGNYQILLGEKNVGDFCVNLDYVAPYVCIMAVGYSNEQPLYKWTKKTIDFILKGGCELYNSFEVSYEKVEDFRLEFSRYKMEIKLESLLDTYVGSKIIDSEFSEKALLALFENYLFTKSICGIFITKRYSCVVFFKKHLLYLFEVFGCDDDGRVKEEGMVGPGCLMRFLDLDSLVKRILENRKSRLPPEDEDVEYTRIVLVKPNVEKTGEDKLEQVVIQKFYNNEGVLIEPEITQSKELAKCSNFVDLPDGSQIIRGTSDVRKYSEDIDSLSPYVCIIAAAVGGKYSVSTWSPDIVNYVLQCGSELHQKSKYQFLEVAKLEIPRVALGKTDFSLEVNYQFDAPLKQRILEVALEKILHQNGDWAVIVAQEYSCSCYYKNGLFYLYDGYATNEVGLSEGPFSPGFASFSRFMDLHSMCTRIIYNKHKRELPEKLTYSRFVLSTCKVRYLQPEYTKPKPRKSKRKIVVEDEMVQPEEEMEIEEEEEEEHLQNVVGFQKIDGFWVIQGTKSMEGRTGISRLLKADHFICLCVCLTVISTPVKKWDTRKVNRAINQGNHIFSHAENLEYSDKRTIKNILIGKHFFDIIVKPIKINNWKRNRNVVMGLKTILSKRKFCLVQFPNCCVVVYKEDDVHYLFDPYSWTYRDSNKETRKIEAGWILYPNPRILMKKIKHLMVDEGQGVYNFYSFEVISVRKAPKKVLMSYEVMQYKLDKSKQNETLGKPFHEQENWLNIHQTPWSRIKDQTACGKFRSSRDSKWHNWDIEYPNDLFSLTGSLHMTSKKFSASNRGKQTLSNLVVAIAMTNIYELSEWTERILDSILYNGDAYFTECTKEITENNYELAMEDLIEECSIFPYNFKVSYAPSIEGTMFLSHRRKFNLYKALRYFFENYESRCGIIIAIKGEHKRLCCFGKTQESEYFMYDCQAMGPPMFFEKEGVSYVLRCTTLARLLHCIVLTLKGGDFFIYDVETYDFEAISPERKDEKKKSKK